VPTIVDKPTTERQVRDHAIGDRYRCNVFDLGCRWLVGSMGTVVPVSSETSQGARCRGCWRWRGDHHQSHNSAAPPGCRDAAAQSGVPVPGIHRRHIWLPRPPDSPSIERRNIWRRSLQANDTGRRNAAATGCRRSGTTPAPRRRRRSIVRRVLRRQIRRRSIEPQAACVAGFGAGSSGVLGRQIRRPCRTLRGRWRSDEMPQKSATSARVN